ncbi:fructosamine kinase family protein [Pectobacteriaceae bacterium CE90]|nr:fructosamine kinase family protein [Prodigiosinella sp. LS101]WJV55754.1 fructosamine kinase family protein [Prodigiosinella sp. LS101]WJV60116.1 fructosamine kinase family protein [Pectobacteriaceae bacterium C111]WJY13181.1 fructosamine kinase family protein [Pectobacteriaceae bacterium CE90]
MWQIISQLLEERLGPGEMLERRELPGGETHPAWYLRYGEYTIFVKCDVREMLPKFMAEAEQLELLARSKTVNVPKVYGVGHFRDDSFLLLEYLTIKPLDAHSAWCLGEQLAHLHQWSDQPQFGLDFDNDLSTTTQPNSWQRRWSTFFSEQRIGWQLQLAEEKGMHFGEINTLIAQVEERLAGHQPQPSLLHGDLWPANCAASPQGAYLFDPACYWGDRECDLAMLPLYPALPPQIYDGYQSIWPLDKGFVERQPLYQIYYLLNRANLFGGRHIVAAQQAIEQQLYSAD